MNFDLTDEQRQIQETFARFCDDKIIPQAAALDEAHAYPHALFKELGALGFFAMRYPAAVGGLDTDLVTLCLALEEIARGSMSLAGCVTMQSLMGTKFLELLGSDDIRNRLPFVLTSDEIGEYNILYVGQQQEDELRCYVFDVAPKEIVGKKRYFQGRIWVDDKDFQIVKTYGKTVPQITGAKHKGKEEHLYPSFTTWREQIDGKYWFPTFTKADDTLHFQLNDVHIREIVKYTNYKRFGARSRITFEGKELPPGEKGQNPQQQGQQPQK